KPECPSRVHVLSAEQTYVPRSSTQAAPSAVTSAMISERTVSWRTLGAAPARARLGRGGGIELDLTRLRFLNRFGASAACRLLVSSDDAPALRHEPALGLRLRFCRWLGARGRARKRGDQGFWPRWGGRGSAPGRNRNVARSRQSRRLPQHAIAEREEADHPQS